jgi:hypothetical protein
MATALFKLATENYLRKGCRVKDNHIFHSLLHTVRMTNCWFHFFTYCWHIFGANKHAEELLAASPRCTGQTGTGHRSGCRVKDNHIFHSLLHTVHMTNCWFHFFTYCWHIFGANKHAEELLVAPPRCTGQTGTGHRSDRCRREDPTRNQRTSPGQDPVEAAHAGLS